jgi:hypothetical protein
MRIDWARCRHSGDHLALEPLTNRLEHNVQPRNNEDTYEARCDHTSKDSCTHGSLRGLTGSGCDDQRNQTENESEGCHHNRTKAKFSPLDGSIYDARALSPLVHRKLDDEDSVLGSERDQYNDPDLRENVVVEPRKLESEHRAKKSDHD